MFLAQHPAAGLQRPLLERARTAMIALRHERPGEVVHARERVRVFFPQHPAVPFQHPLLEHARAAKIVLRPERRGEVTHARERVRVFLPQHPARASSTRSWSARVPA